MLHRLVDVGDALLGGRAPATWFIPTHVSGWIDPVVLVERASSADATAPFPGFAIKCLLCCGSRQSGEMKR